jgi:hypothetical protein
MPLKQALILFSVLIASHAQAQSSSEMLTLEVVFRPADPFERGVRMQSLSGDGLRSENARLRALIEWAYNIKSFKLSGGPDWINTWDGTSWPK